MGKKVINGTGVTHCTWNFYTYLLAFFLQGV